MTAVEANPRANLSGMTFTQLRDWIDDNTDLKPYRTGQRFSWIHQKRARAFSEMTSISKSTRELLDSIAILTWPNTDSRLVSSDGTSKYSFILQDGSKVESVLIPDHPRLTACLSTQVGCRFGCRICQTGRMGFQRNLNSGEIVGQLYRLQEEAGARISNVVFMGMGEPLDNFPELRRALSIITDDRGICIGARKITVSTVGIPGGIPKLQELGGQYGLAISLHSAIEKTRRMLVPVSASLPLSRLKGELLSYSRTKGRRVTLEYCLISGVNDSLEQAGALVEFSRGLPCKINLLLYNPTDDYSLAAPSAEKVDAFVEYLYPRSQAVTLRRSRGSDICAACGQLGRRVGISEDQGSGDPQS